MSNPPRQREMELKSLSFNLPPCTMIKTSGDDVIEFKQERWVEKKILSNQFRFSICWLHL
jgi:hypothetical protein